MCLWTAVTDTPTPVKDTGVMAERESEAVNHSLGGTGEKDAVCRHFSKLKIFTPPIRLLLSLLLILREAKAN